MICEKDGEGGGGGGMEPSLKAGQIWPELGVGGVRSGRGDTTVCLGTHLLQTPHLLVRQVPDGCY